MDVAKKGKSTKKGRLACEKQQGSNPKNLSPKRVADITPYSSQWRRAEYLDVKTSGESKNKTYAGRDEERTAKRPHYTIRKAVSNRTGERRRLRSTQDRGSGHEQKSGTGIQAKHASGWAEEGGYWKKNWGRCRLPGGEKE